MSIDLRITFTKPIKVSELLPKAAAVLTEMLSLRNQLTLTLHERSLDECHPLQDAELRQGEGTLVSVAVEANMDDGIDIHAGESVTVIMQPGHSNLQFALGAAVAIALARELGEIIRDESLIYGNKWRKAPEEVFEYMKVPGSWDDYYEAAEQLADRFPE